MLIISLIINLLSINEPKVLIKYIDPKLSPYGSIDSLQFEKYSDKSHVELDDSVAFKLLNLLQDEMNIKQTECNLMRDLRVKIVNGNDTYWIDSHGYWFRNGLCFENELARKYLKDRLSIFWWRDILLQDSVRN